MKGSTVDIIATPAALTILIKKDEPLSGFQSFMMGLAGVGHLIILLFIWKSVTSDGLPMMKVLFVVVGFFGLYSVNKQLQRLLLYSKGVDTVEVTRGQLRLTSKLGLLRKTESVALVEIKKIELLDSSDAPHGMNMFSPNAMRSGYVRVLWGLKNELHIGQYLGRRELEKVFQEVMGRMTAVIE